jgi:hypothetical protein
VNSELTRDDIISILEMIEHNVQYDDDDTAAYWLGVANRLSNHLNSTFPY